MGDVLVFTPVGGAMLRAWWLLAVRRDDAGCIPGVPTSLRGRCVGEVGFGVVYWPLERWYGSHQSVMCRVEVRAALRVTLMTHKPHTRWDAGQPVMFQGLWLTHGGSGAAHGLCHGCGDVDQQAWPGWRATSAHITLVTPGCTLHFTLMKH